MSTGPYTTVRISSRDYEDHDDCLTAAAEDYIDSHDMAGWEPDNLDPRWDGGDDGEREHILLTVPESFAD